jgi:HEAT repeat protein
MEGGPEGLLACLTLAELGPRARAALPTLLELLESPNQHVALLAAQAFGAMGPDAVKHAPDLLDKSILPSPFMFVARTALAAMGEDVVPVLVKALEEGDVIRQQRAVSALELMGPKAAAAVPTLIGLLPAAQPKMAIYDDWGTVQVTAIRTLGEIGKAARPALPALRKLAALRPGARFQAAASLAVTLIEIAGR